MLCEYFQAVFGLELADKSWIPIAADLETGLGEGNF